MTHIELQCGDRHHEARRTEAALGAVVVNHGLLGWVKGVRRQVLNRQHLFPIHHAQQQDARVGCCVLEAVVVQLSDQHGTSPAVAFGTAFFGPGQACLVSEIIQQRETGIIHTDFKRRTAEDKADLISTGLHESDCPTG